MYRNGADLQKAETCHMVMWFGGVGAGGGWVWWWGLGQKKNKNYKELHGKNVKINANKKVNKGTRLYI